jgi:hypothetical protein
MGSRCKRAVVNDSVVGVAGHIEHLDSQTCHRQARVRCLRDTRRDLTKVEETSP